MKPLAYLMLIAAFALPACTSARLSHDEARKKIAAIGTSGFVPDAIEIRRIISQNDTDAIAEATVSLAFQFKRDKTAGDWRVAAVRLGDRDWISLDELLAAVAEGRRRSTAESMQKLADGIEKYKTSNGTLPPAGDIVTLTDTLHPLYLSDLIRVDGWGRPLNYEVRGATFRLTSNGADGRRGTTDDVVLESGLSGAP